MASWFMLRRWRAALRRSLSYDPNVDTTAPAILELGLVLLAAAGAGWVARRLTLPAVVGYLVVGLAVSPFAPVAWLAMACCSIRTDCAGSTETSSSPRPSRSC